MQYRELGHTGVKVSEVGMGCNRLGEANQSDAFWIGLVQRAVDLGVNLFDTAESYKGGGSEELLGCAIGHRDDVLVATKVGGPGQDFSATRVMKAAEATLTRLKRDRIDIYHLHSPNRQEMERFDWADAMTKLKEQEKIRFRAVATNRAADAVWLIEQQLVEVIQITYSTFVTDAEEGLFSLAQASGVGLLCRMPLAQGILTGKFRPGQPIPADHRAHRAYGQMSPRINMAWDLRPLAAKYEGGMTRLALHFSLMPPAISAIIPGSRTIQQLEENVAASNGAGMSSDIRARLDEIRTAWVQEQGQSVP